MAGVLAVLLVLASLLLDARPAHASQPGELLSVKQTAHYPVAEIQTEITPLFEPFGLPDVTYPVDVYWIQFHSSDFDGSPAVARAQLFIPLLRREADAVPSIEPYGDERTEGEITPLPILTFGSGTTGIAERCAPILEIPELNRWGSYHANMLAYAAEGFIVIFPEYIGFGDPDTPQRYFSKAAEAYVMLDSIRAVYRFFDTTFSDGTFSDGTNRSDFYRLLPSKTVFAAGYSQGGHAAHAAADLRPDYAPELPLTGLVGFGQTNNVATLMREMAYYAPYIIYTFAEMYGHDEIDPADYLQPKWLPTLEEDMYRFCVEEFQFYYPMKGEELYTAEFHAALVEERLHDEFPAMAKRLEENLAGLSGHGLPALVLQGEQDIIITTPEQTRFVEQLCAAGSAVTYEVLPGARHRDVRPAGFRLSVEWMRALARGDEPPQVDCD